VTAPTAEPDALREEHEALLQFLYLAPVGLVQATRDGDIALLNPVSAQLLLPLGSGGQLANLFDALADVAPDLRRLVREHPRPNGVVCENLRVALPGGGGERRHPTVLAVTLVLLDAQRLMAVLQDVTATVRRERELREREAWFNAILTGIRDYALVHLDAEGRVACWNESIGRVTGHGADAVVGRPFTLWQGTESLTGHAVADRLHEADRNGWSLEEGWRLRADGSRFWASALLAPLEARRPGDDAAAPTGPDERSYSLILRDISDKREASEALRRATRCDQLTGLANRHAFFEAADVEIARRRRRPRALSLAVFDADEFKRVNDRHGHPTGDLVLRRIGEILGASFRPVDTVARLGGEEFVVLLPSVGLDEARRIAERCRLAVETVVVPSLEGDVRITLSGGVSTLRADEHDLDALIRRADRALYRAKAAGRNRVETLDAGAPALAV
jgi:diguanylate cyclase (GGDEF)-like protein/PAS domain S-box-containing protein